MSGPKGGSYRVETPAQIEARRLRDARADYARAEQEWAAATARMATITAIDGTVLSHPRPEAVHRRADAAVLAAAATALRQAASGATALADGARRRAAHAQHEDQLARLLENVAVEHRSAPQSSRPSRWQASLTAAAPPAPSPTVDRVRAVRRVRSRLDALAALEHDSAIVASLVADIGTAGTDERVDLLIAELDFVAERAREAAARDARVQTTRADLFALQARLAAVDTAEADQLRTRIADAIDAGIAYVPDDLAAAVQSLITDTDADADRAHVVRAVKAALIELGYATGPEFSIGLSGVPATGYARRGRSNYGIKLRLEPGAQRFTAQPVKTDVTVTSTAEDVAAETEFCAVMERITEMAARDGVALDLDIRTAPGVCAVQTVAAAILPTSISASATRVRGERLRKQGSQ